MIGNSAGVSRWTRYFVAASAACFVAYFASVLAAWPLRVQVLFGLFGFVCLMVFGMGYLLLPPYAGRTIADHRFAGVQFALVIPGLCLLVVDRLLDAPPVLGRLGSVLWAGGVVAFVAALAATVHRRGRGPDVPAAGVPGTGAASRVAVAVLPVAVLYLVGGTLAHLGAVGLPVPVPFWLPLRAASHAYAAGFATLLVFALSARLLTGFFSATPPRRLLDVVAVAGAIAPLLLSTGLWVDPWFRVGAVLETAAVTGYAVTVAVVLRQSDRVRVGGYGVVAGAVAGVAATMAGASAAFGVGAADAVRLHVRLALGGFLPLTVAGYAFLFFPVTGGQFRGAMPRTAAAALALLAGGLVLQVAGVVVFGAAVDAAGAAVSLLGGLTYLYLLGRRLLGS